MVNKAAYDAKYGKCLKILTILNKCFKEALTTVLAQVKAGSAAENLLNEIRQIIHFLYQENKILKKYITR